MKKHDYEVRNSADLNKMLSEALMEVRRGELDIDTAKSITAVADKINKNNINSLVYKKLTRHKEDLSFFEGEIK